MKRALPRNLLHVGTVRMRRVCDWNTTLRMYQSDIMYVDAKGLVHATSARRLTLRACKRWERNCFACGKWW